MFWARGTRNALAARLRCQSAPPSTRLSPERHRQHTPRATRTRTRGGGAAFGVMNSPPRTQRTSSTARRSPGSGPRGRHKWMMAAYLWGEILADVCMTSFIFHCCAGEPPLNVRDRHLHFYSAAQIHRRCHQTCSQSCQIGRFLAPNCGADRHHRTHQAARAHIVCV